MYQWPPFSFFDQQLVKEEGSDAPHPLFKVPHRLWVRVTASLTRRAGAEHRLLCERSRKYYCWGYVLSICA